MKQGLKLHFCICILFFCTLLSIVGQDTVNLNFINTDLERFIEFVAKETGKRILYDSTIRGRKIFLVSATPVSRKNLFKIFLSVMEYNSYILERTGAKGAEIIKVKRNIQGPWTPTRTIYTEEELDKIEKEDQFISMVIKLTYISAREVQTTLRALRIVSPQGGNLAGIEGSNTILITDFAPNVKRIYDVIKLMDQKGPEKKFKVIKLKYAVADDIVEKLKDFLGKNTRSRGIGLGPDLEEVKIVANSRLNAVIVQAYSEKMKHVITLIDEIDQQLETEPSNIHYIRLKHADAVKLQETLSKLLESGSLTKKATTGSSRTASPISSDSGIKTSIQAEPQTNSLIVKAESHDWREIKKIIQQVDVRRPQVLIEGALIEVSPDDMLGLGIELFWAETPRSDRPTFAGGSNFGFSNLAVVDENGDAQVINGNTTQIENGQTYGNVPIQTRTDFNRGTTAAVTYKDMFTIPAILKAIQTKTSFKILSIPSILTNDHEMAQIKVADAQPARSIKDNDSGNSTVGFEGFEEAGTTLTVTPHISGEKNYLRLELSQVIAEFQGTRDPQTGVSPKRTREIKTTITVPDGQTVAIGGFTFDSQSETLEKIPFLGDLPLIGILFQTRTITHSKRNIYLFITPHILREKNFKDLHKHSFEYKIKAHKLGANVGLFDKSFKKYLDKYGIKKADDPSPVFMLDYQRSSNKKK